MTISERKEEMIQKFQNTVQQVQRLQHELQQANVLLEQQRGALIMLDELLEGSNANVEPAEVPA